jgi:trehalose synthase
MEEVEIKPVPLDRLSALLSPERAQHLADSAERARQSFGDRVVWHVNATAHGGGVAEMLQTLLAYGNGAGVTNRWLVLTGDPEFFTITKRLHNMLHGSRGDGGVLGEAEHTHYEAVLETNLADLRSRIGPGDIVLLHDPQTAGLCAGLREIGAHVVWRCHVGRDEPTEVTEAGWGFLRPYLEHAAEAFVFSRRVYAPLWIDSARLVVISPSIDPFSTKNVELAPDVVEAVLATVGLVTGGNPDGPIDYVRRNGRPGTVRTHHANGGLIVDGPPPPYDARLVVQVSRWDHLKDMAGVMEGFARMAADDPDGDAHLMLVGPEVTGVTDDPEGAEVLAECSAAWGKLPDAVRARVHLASIPMDDGDENAIIVNALQRHAWVVVQKSLVEGFGLTVTEALWKGRPVVASNVGGIADQIVDGREGLLVRDPRDLDEFARTLRRVLDDDALAARLGVGARARVLEEFLGDRHLDQYVELFAGLVSGPSAEPTGTAARRSG